MAHRVHAEGSGANWRAQNARCSKGTCASMSTASGPDEPVVEKPPNDGEPDVTLRALQQRIRQQEILAELGVIALQGPSLEELLSRAAQLTAEGLRAEFCKVLEHIPDRNCFRVRAGVGWGPGVVGVATVGADLASPAGFALRTGKPVISNHLENEERFRTPEILAEHGIYRAMNVILQGDGRPFGVLEVDSRSEDEFVEHDLAFLQGAANILGMAIERERQERSLKSALNRHQLLLKEMNHRVKNSLSMASSMLRLQAAEIGDDKLTQLLDEASMRILAIGRAHDRLHQGEAIDTLDLGGYIDQVCQDLDEGGTCDVHADAERGITVAIDRAVPAALIVTELVTNAAKYAYRDSAGGKIYARVAREGDKNVVLAVRDEGDGLPKDFDLRNPKGLGMRIVSALTEQLDADLTVLRSGAGTEFVLTMPLAAKL
jgi:two-component sensor histidine kinase